MGGKLSMSYNRSGLVIRIRGALQKRPLTSVTRLAVDLGIGRHTITRALRKNGGKSFRDLQDEYLIDRLVSLRSSETLSVKQIAYELGYRSPGSLSRRLHRMLGERPTRLLRHGRITDEAVLEKLRLTQRR